MITPQAARMLTRYNSWANKLIFDAVAGLPGDEATKERQSLFKNMVHTLNHNYVIDRVWEDPSPASPRIAIAQLDRPGGALAHTQVEHLHADRKGHREVHVALGHVVVEAVGDQHDADHEEEGERQHFHRRMRRDEAPDRAREGHHEEHRGDHRRDHDLDPVDHADCG